MIPVGRTGLVWRRVTSKKKFKKIKRCTSCVNGKTQWSGVEKLIYGYRP